MRYRNLYEQIKSETAQGGVTVKEKHWLRVPLICCILPALFLLIYLVLRSNQKLMNVMVFQVTTPIKHILAGINAHLPFAVGEVVWAVAMFALLVFLIRTVYLLIRYQNRGQRLIRRILALISAGLIVYSCYTVMWGINYYAESFASRSGLTARGCTVQELYTLTSSFAERCNALSGEMPRGETGTTVLNNDELFCNAEALYSNIQTEFSALNVPVYDPKPMFFSPVISAMGFTGFYFPMTAESLVNVEQADCLIPATILHELAHQCNVAEEDAANFVAILAGLHSEDSVFQYSSALLGYIHLSNALYSANREAWQEVRDILNEQVRADLDENNAFWDKYESPVKTASETIYEGYLKSVGHSEGMKSYGQCVDLLTAYYFDK